MRLILRDLRRLVAEEEPAPVPKQGFSRLKVLYCAICRTDARMWSEGHRDLVLPRVPGHEIVAQDHHGNRFAIWPGQACGACRFCRNGRENLCDQMKIIGFHSDGGFANHVTAPENSLIAVPAAVPTHLACFAEPIGCVLHALEKLAPSPGEKMIILGAGTLGMITALVSRGMGVLPLVIEKNEAKIQRITPFLRHAGIQCLQETSQRDFDLAVNACTDPAAFNQCLLKLGKGGRMSFFSALARNQAIETKLVNILHYREIQMHGSYGLRRMHMAPALDLIGTRTQAFEMLIENIVPAHEAATWMPLVLSGHCLKIILDFG